MRNVEYKVPRFFADSDGALGVLLAKLDLKVEMKARATQYSSFRQSDCLRRIEGKWHSFFEMRSFPADPMTGKAILSNTAAFQ